MDTKALRQKILDLAIRGKLVPQDPNDEPASVLLERIKAEKERLIKEGKIKKKPKSAKTSDTPHYQNVPFGVPSGWGWCRLEDIAQSNIGLTYKPTDITEKGIPVYRSNNIQNRKIDKSDIVRVKAQILKKQFLNIGDLLICARNGSRRLVGKCAIIEELDEATSFGAFMAVCRSKYNRWIFTLLNTTYFDRYLDDSNSTAINQVTQSMLLAFQIPFPPLAEQQRIIAEIELWFALIDIIEQGKADLQIAITQAKSKILGLAIHGKLVPQDPNDEPASELLKRINPNAEITSDNGHYLFDIPNGWVMCKLGDVCSFENGYAFSSDDYKSCGTPLIRISNIKENRITTDNSVYIKGDCEKRFHVHKGDLLIAMSGATTGKMGVYQYDNMAYLNQRVGNLKIKNDILFPEYRNCYMFSQIEKILELAYGGAQPNISSKVICEFLFPLPPLAEQQRIVQKIEELFSVLDNIQNALEV